MTAHVPMARVPFAPLDNPRLQHLASAKNRQSGLISRKSLCGKPTGIVKNAVVATGKRPLESTFFDEQDGENVDPAVLDSPSKKSKAEMNSFTFRLTTPMKSMPPPSAFPSRLSTPSRAHTGSPRAPLTAPAGRSPKRKIAGIGKNRRVSAPFKCIDPPASHAASVLPFSLDAALNASFSKPVSNDGATIEQSMPKSWFFDIYEDSPEEEAANLMEHSTLTLDLGSDDECNKKIDDLEKENTPPEGYHAPTASRAAAVPKTELVRRKVVKEDEMEDGQRSPLSDLETEPFFPEGLDKDSHVVVDDVLEKHIEAFPARVAKKEEHEVMPAVDHKKDMLHDKAAEIVVWEDHTC